MKKVLGGSVYNTETSRKLGGAASNLPMSDFGYWEEELYCTKAGRYFLFGEGYSRYGHWDGSSGGWGEKIIPLSVERARAWAEKNLEADKVMAEFEITDDASRTSLQLTVTRNVKSLLEAERAKTKRSITDLVESAVMSIYGEK